MRKFSFLVGDSSKFEDEKDLVWTYQKGREYVKFIQVFSVEVLEGSYLKDLPLAEDIALTLGRAKAWAKGLNPRNSITAIVEENE